jgi:hypothetical protein
MLIVCVYERLNTKAAQETSLSIWNPDTKVFMYALTNINLFEYVI